MTTAPFDAASRFFDELHSLLISRTVSGDDTIQELLTDGRFEVTAVGTYRSGEEVGLHLTVQPRTGDEARAYVWLHAFPKAGFTDQDHADVWLASVLIELVEEFQSFRALQMLTPVTWTPGAFG